MEKTRLGLGLKEIFGSFEMQNNKNALNIEISKIKIAKWQPRKNFDETALQELSESIKEYGVLQPILVRKIEDNFYEIVAGERRYRASKMANLTHIPAIILEENSKKNLEISLIENLQRQELNPTEKAQSFAFLIEKLNITQEELAKKLNLSRSYIANYLRMNNLDDEIKEKIDKNQISVGHAKILVSKKNAKELANKIVEENLTVRDLEKLDKEPQGKAKSNADVERLQEMIANALNNEFKVQIVMEKTEKKIVLSFDKLEQLEELISKLICL